MLTVNILESDELDDKDGYKVEVIKDGKSYRLEHIAGYDDLEELVLSDREVWLLFDRLETVVTETEWKKNAE